MDANARALARPRPGRRLRRGRQGAVAAHRPHMTIHLARHGQTAYNARGPLPGPPARCRSTPPGREQAARARRGRRGRRDRLARGAARCARARETADDRRRAHRPRAASRTRASPRPTPATGRTARSPSPAPRTPRASRASSARTRRSAIPGGESFAEQSDRVAGRARRPARAAGGAAGARGLPPRRHPPRARGRARRRDRRRARDRQRVAGDAVSRLTAGVFAVLVVATFGGLLRRAAAQERAARRSAQLRVRPFFSPNGDGRFDVARVSLPGSRRPTTSRVAVVDADGDEVRELHRRPPRAAYRELVRAEVGRAQRRRRARARRRATATASRSQHEGRSVVPASSVRLDTTPPRPRVTVDRPAATRSGPSCCPRRRRRRRRAPRTRPGAAAGRPAVQDRARADARWCVEDDSLRRRRDTVDAGTARRRAGARSRPGTYLVAIETRDQAGNRRPLAAARPPRPARGELRRQAARAAAASPSATSACAAQRRHAARATRSSSSSTRARKPLDVVGAPRRLERGRRRSRRKTSARVRLHAPGRESGVYLLRGAHAPRAPRTVPVRGPERRAPPRPRRPAGHDLAGAQLARRRRRRPAERARPRRRRQARSASTPATACPPASPRATRRCWPGWTAAATATTSRPTSRSPPAAARAWRTTAASSCPPTRAGCRARLQQRLRRYVRGGGTRRLASASTRCAARSRSRRRGRLVDPTPPATTDLFGVRLRPLHAPAQADATSSRPATTSTSSPAPTGAFGPFSLVQEAELAGPRPRASAVDRGPADRPRRSSRPSASARGSCSASALPELPVAPRRARQRPEHRPPCWTRTWTLLSR